MSLLIKYFKTLFLIVFALIAAGRLLTQSSWVTSYVTQQLEQVFEGHIYLGRVTLNLSGNVRVQDFEIHIEGIPLAHAHRGNIDFDLLSILTGAPQINSIDFDSLHLRFIRDLMGESLWQQLKKNISSRDHKVSKQSFAQHVPVNIQQIDVLVETRQHHFFSFRDLSTQDISMNLSTQSFQVTGTLKGQGIAPFQFVFDTNPQEELLLVQAQALPWTDELAGCLPPPIRHPILLWKPQGTLNAVFKRQLKKNPHSLEMNFEVSPHHLSATLPQSRHTLDLVEGKFVWDASNQGVTATGICYESPLISGEGQWSQGLGRWRYLLKPQPHLYNQLPTRLASFLQWIQPKASFQGTVWQRSRAYSAEAHFQNLKATGIRPMIDKASGSVTIDQTSGQPLQGRIDVSSLGIMDLFFNQSQIEFIDQEGVVLTGPDSQFRLSGPWVSAHGSLKGSQGSVKGDIWIKNLDVASWTRQWGLADSFPLSGILNGRLNLTQASKKASSKTALGTLDFKIKDAQFEVTNNLLPIAHILRALQNALTLKGLFSKEPLNKQIITKAEGQAVIYPDHLEITAELEGYPLKFDLKGSLDYQKNGRLKIKPIPLTRLPIDPTKILLELVPIEFKWQDGKVISK